MFDQREGTWFCGECDREIGEELPDWIFCPFCAAPRTAVRGSFERPSITWPDLLAVIRDDFASLRGATFDEWVARENFTTEALVRVTRFLTSSWAKSGEKVETLGLMAFTCGWAAHRDLRGERE